eukprot:superscaffoldBa00000864_g7683
MAQCSEPATVSSAVNGELKKERKVAVITGITGQTTLSTASTDTQRMDSVNTSITPALKYESVIVRVITFTLPVTEPAPLVYIRQLQLFRLVFHIGLAWNALTLARGQENMTPAGALNAVGTGLPAVARPYLPYLQEQGPHAALKHDHLSDSRLIFCLLQDGSYLAEFLLAKGYEVHGILRRSSSFNTGRIEHLYQNPQTHTEGNMKLHYGDLTDSTCLVKIINQVKPTEIYNLGAQSHVKVA